MRSSFLPIAFSDGKLFPLFLKDALAHAKLTHHQAAFVLLQCFDCAQAKLKLIVQTERSIVQRDMLAELFCRIEQDDAAESLPSRRRHVRPATFRPQEREPPISVEPLDSAFDRHAAIRSR